VKSNTNLDDSESSIEESENSGAYSEEKKPKLASDKLKMLLFGGIGDPIIKSKNEDEAISRLNKFSVGLKNVQEKRKALEAPKVSLE
jgi:hypothetical protein